MFSQHRNFTIITLSAILMHINYISEWQQVETSKFIDHDLDTSTLMIRTDSWIRAGTYLGVRFYRHSTNASPSGIDIDMNSSWYKIFKCRDSWIRFSTDLPNDGVRIWKITKTPEIRLIIHCNDKEVLNVQLSEAVCKNFKNNWQNFWGWGKGLQERVKFAYHQSKTDLYMSIAAQGDFYFFSFFLISLFIALKFHRP